MSTAVGDPLVGVLLDGRYRLDRLIAKGGMAAVYAATDTRLDRVVAVKTMRPMLAEDPDFVARFAQEARAAARLSSPEVVAVHDQGTDAVTGTAYLVMEHVDGGTLRDVLRTHGALSPARALDLVEPVLVALAAAHAAGLVHRDVKPENVLLSSDGRVKVADFGLARAVETSGLTATTGLLIGTVAYLAPEQVEHGRADTRTDVYAAGILLWELLTGTPPYSSDSPMSVAYRHVHDDVPPPGSVVDGVPAALDELVVRATRRDPAARPVDGGAFLAELRAVRGDLSDRPSHTTLVVPRSALLPPPDATPDDPGRRPRRRVVLGLVLTLLLALVAGGGWYAAVGRYTEAPAVEGLTKVEAQAALQEAGFRVELLPSVFSDTVPAQRIVDQDPGPGERVVKGGTITLLNSKGPETRAVPTLVGLTQAEATAALAQAGLEPGTVERRFSDAPVGTVVGSAPEAGQRARPGSAVQLVVSKGVEMVGVPDVVGDSRASADEKLTRLGFGVTVTEVFSGSVAKGRVVSQAPGGGTAPRGSRVALEVSKGPEMVTVPDVLGQPRAAALAALEAAGLKTRVIAIPGPGRVRSTDPDGGSRVRKGSTVTVYVF